MPLNWIKEFVYVLYYRSQNRFPIAITFQLNFWWLQEIPEKSVVSISLKRTVISQINNIIMAEVENNGACKYAGYIPSENGLSIDRVNLDQISKEDFFRLFVKPRKPAIVTRLQKPMAALQTLWTDEYLIQTAGSALVTVEKRADTSDALFGVVAPKVSMKYRDFVNELKAANDRLYMTTQDPESEEDTATPKLLAEPVLSLQKDFPLQPELLGHLVPYQISLWQGFARDGASSGLHHDFHDNLYLLLRGKKRFRLFPPSAAVHMSTHGEIDVIYPNGLIVYRRSAKGGKRLSKTYVREDGALKKDVAEAKRVSNFILHISIS